MNVPYNIARTKSSVSLKIKCSKWKKEICEGQKVFSFMDMCFSIFSKKSQESLMNTGKFCENHNSTIFYFQYGFQKYIEHCVKLLVDVGKYETNPLTAYMS